MRVPFWFDALLALTLFFRAQWRMLCSFKSMLLSWYSSARALHFSFCVCDAVRLIGACFVGLLFLNTHTHTCRYSFAPEALFARATCCYARAGLSNNCLAARATSYIATHRLLTVALTCIMPFVIMILADMYVLWSLLMLL